MTMIFMKRNILAHDMRPQGNGLVVLKKRRNQVIVEPIIGSVHTEKPKYVLLPSFHDTHNHPLLYGMIQAADPVALNETTNKQKIFQKLIEKAKGNEDGPILALNYSMEAKVTSYELDGLNLRRPILLVSTSLHGGVGNSELLSKLQKRKKEGMSGEIKQNGEITEDCFFSALGIIEEEMGERIVQGVHDWTIQRIREGTTTITDKAFLTTAQWEIFKEAKKRLEETLGYNPIPEVYLFYPAYFGNLKKYALEAEKIGVRLGVKWVGDGGTTSQTASMEHFSYSDGTKGLEPTIPINHENPNEVQDYIDELKDAGITRMAFHAIGDKTIEIALRLAPTLRKNGIDLTIAHFEVPTLGQISRAARMNIPIDMQPAYASEVFRYQSLSNLGYYNAPIGTIIREYEAVSGNSSQITLSTDGMPSDMSTIGLGCAIGHPYPEHQISVESYFEHSEDRNVMNSFIVMEIETYRRILEMRNPEVLKKYVLDLDGTSKELQKGVLAVSANGRLLSDSNLEL
jgi:hypothetical protein